MSPTSVISPAPTRLVVTYTATSVLSSGVVTVAVPVGWTAPSTSNTSASTGTVSVVGSTITVSGVSLTAGQDMNVTYGAATKVVPTATDGYDVFTVSMSPTDSGAPSQLGTSPSVFVYAKGPPALFRDVTTVHLGVFNRVGISEPASFGPLIPTIDRHQPSFVAVVDGKKVPAAFFWGAEYCPFCGPTSWGLIVALARFGTFNQLYEITSSPDDIYPNTPSLTFHLSHYTSPFLSFKGYEVDGPFLQPLDVTPRSVRLLVQKYNSQGEFPFVDIGNLTFMLGANFDPGPLLGLRQGEIAANLVNPSNPVTRAIVATANYYSAGICASDGEHPGKVCTSSGVIRADRALGLPRPKG